MNFSYGQENYVKREGNENCPLNTLFLLIDEAGRRIHNLCSPHSKKNMNKEEIPVGLYFGKCIWGKNGR